jgi:hypothetical protein
MNFATIIIINNKVSIPDKTTSRNQISSQNNYFIISENQISISLELSGYNGGQEPTNPDKTVKLKNAFVADNAEFRITGFWIIELLLYCKPKSTARGSLIKNR